MEKVNKNHCQMDSRVASMLRAHGSVKRLNPNQGSVDWA